MIPIYHFIASLVLVAVLYPYFGAASLIVFLTGWLIDFDHVMYYVLKARDISWKRMYSFYRYNKYKERVVNVFHTAEFYIFVAVLAFYSKYMLIAAIGLFAHIAMDFMHFVYLGKYHLRYHTLTGWILDKIRRKRSRAF